MKYHILYKEKLWMTCNNEAECEDNIKGLNPPNTHSDFRIISHEELTIGMTKKEKQK